MSGILDPQLTLLLESIILVKQIYSFDRIHQ